ncbi:MAG: thioredoxin family protein [Acidimicrobiales bacterium]
MAATSHMLDLGTVAPDFDLADPDGNRVTRDDAAGEHGLLVAFVCNHCPYVKHVGRELGLLTQRWMSRGVGVVGINSNDPEAYPDDAPDTMAAAARGWGWDFPYLVDETQQVAKDYRAACTPDFFLFDRDLRLVYRGQMDESRPGSDVPVTGADLDAAVKAVIAGEAVPADQAPSMGCSIKWRPGNEPT